MNQTEIDRGDLAAMEGDPLLSRREAIADVRECILVVAQLTATHRVTAGSVRPYYKTRTTQYPERISATWNGLIRRGILRRVPGVAEPSGNRESGNEHRLMPVYECDTDALRTLIELEAV